MTKEQVRKKGKANHNGGLNPPPYKISAQHHLVQQESVSLYVKNGILIAHYEATAP